MLHALLSVLLGIVVLTVGVAAVLGLSCGISWLVKKVEYTVVESIFWSLVCLFLLILVSWLVFSIGDAILG